MVRHPIVGFAAVLALVAGVVACRGDDDAPSPGGINGPARVEPNSGATNSGGVTDD